MMIVEPAMLTIRVRIRERGSDFPTPLRWSLRGWMNISFVIEQLCEVPSRK